MNLFTKGMKPHAGSRIMIVSEIKRPDPESLKRMIASSKSGKPPEVDIFNHVIKQSGGRK